METRKKCLGNISIVRDVWWVFLLYVSYACASSGEVRIKQNFQHYNKLDNTYYIYRHIWCKIFYWLEDPVLSDISFRDVYSCVQSLFGLLAKLHSVFTFFNHI